LVLVVLTVLYSAVVSANVCPLYRHIKIIEENFDEVCFKKRSETTGR